MRRGRGGAVVTHHNEFFIYSAIQCDRVLVLRRLTWALCCSHCMMQYCHVGIGICIMAFCNMMVRPASMYRRCPFELALSDACCSRNRPGCDYISYISCIRLIDQPTHYAFLGRRGGEPVMKVWEKPSQTRKTMSLSIKQNYIALGKPRPMKNQKQSPSSHHQLVQPLLLRSSLWSGVFDSS